MSFMQRRNRSGPKIDPLGTPLKNCPGSEQDLFKFNSNFLYDIYGLNQKMAYLENPENYILLVRIS